MNKYLLRLSKLATAIVILSSALIATTTSYAQTAPPPNFGEETKGAPAVEETVSDSQDTATVSANDTAEEANQTTSAFGNSTVIESRRESGQVYSIELQHSNAPNQYIEETDSDGNIEYKSNDLEETPNLPKWKLGSW